MNTLNIINWLCFKFTILFNLINLINTQSLSPVLKPVPKFSIDTIKQADNIILFDNFPLNTVILRAEASTYQSASPIIYSLIDPLSYFKIDSITGVIVLYEPIDKLTYQFTIVAKDSAPFPDQQTSFLTANVVVISSTNKPPEFNNNYPYYVSVLDIIAPNSIIYDSIIIKDYSSGQNGILNVFCDTNTSENPDAKISCEYFKPEAKMIELGLYRCFIRLLKKLDYNIKRNYIITITAQVGTQMLLGSSSNILIEVSNPSRFSPRFINSPYNLFIKPDTKLNSNVLKLTVANVNISSPDLSFTLYDPKNYFSILNDSYFNCQIDYCNQFIFLKSSINQITEYTMNVLFKQKISDTIQTANAQINVIIQRPKVSSSPPSFLNLPYQFIISENLKTNDLARNVSITVYESNKLSIYNSGFVLELLNTDFTYANDVFEIAPNYGVGLLVSTLKLKQNAILDYENGKRIYNYIVKATSRSASNLFSYANLTLLIQDHNEFSPIFDKSHYSVVLNKPEEYKMGDIIIKVNASDQDADAIGNDLVYRIIGPNKDRFYIDVNGQVRLFKNFNLVQDENTFYNVTIMVTDSGGLSGFTSLMVYLNITSAITLKQSSFQCACASFRSELDQIDFMTLKPKLFILADSIYTLRYFLVETIPYIPDIKIDRNTGEITINKPINSSIIYPYDRIILNIQIFQLKQINNTYDLFEIYQSSVLCSATVYLKQIDINTNSMQRQPYFLQKYSTIVYREYVFKSVGLIKVQAISMNPNNMLPLSYSIVNDSSQLFTIDSTQGFIYPRIDHGLEPKIYSILVQATDLTDNYFTTTTVTISVISKLENELLCDTEYLLLKIDSNELSSSSLPYIFGQLKCYSISFFNDTPIFYEISRSIATYDCNGIKINYTPNIGIDYKSGKLASFEKFANRQFCDASFTITARKDYASIQVPFRLVLVHPIISKPPMFMSPLTQISYSNIYLHIGSYLTTVIAFDPTFNILIENYAIVAQRSNNASIQSVLEIDSKTGIVTLMSQLFVKNVQVDIIATTLGGFSSSLTINLDFLSHFQNSPSNIYFDSSLRNYASINKNQLSSIPIYKAIAKCSLFNQPSIQTQCGQLNYTLVYSKEYLNTASFIIDSSTGNIYLSSSSILDLSIQSKYLILINAFNQNSIVPDRYIRFSQKEFTLLIESKEKSSPIFEKNSYSIQILDTTPVGKPILTMRYRNTNNQYNSVDYIVEEASNSLLDKYFYLEQSSALQTIYLYVLTTPIPTDKPEINFVIRLRNRFTSHITYEFYDKSFALVNIRIVATASRTMSSYFNFIIPNGASYIVVLNSSTINTTIAYQLQTTNQNQNIRSIVSYRILNQDASMFFVDKNLIRLAYPFSDQIDKKRLSYLLFIEAKDLTNPSLGSTYTTIDMRLNNILGAIPYFNREPNSPPINLQIVENFPLNTQVYNLTSLIYAPAFCSNIYYYVYNNMPPYRLSETFFVNPITKSLELKKQLNQTIRKSYNLFIYIANTPLFLNHFINPTPNNTALLFLNINVIGPSELSSNLQFIDVTSYMLIEELMPLGYAIGYAKVNSSFNSVNYSIISCDYHSKTVIYKDATFCDLFRIDSDTGFIYTDASNYAPFRTNFFVLKVAANDPNDSYEYAYVELKAFVVNYQEKSRFIFYQPPTEQLIDNLNYLKRQLNFELNLKKCGVYYFEYFNYAIPNITKPNQDFEACFYIVKLKENVVTTFEETYSLLTTDKIKSLLDSYSIVEINRCNISEYNTTHINEYYNKYGEWIFTSYSLGLILLACLTILFTLLAICLVATCWASHMRQATLAPSMELENVDNCSNNLLIED